MASNPYVNKVEYNGGTLIDLTSDDVSAQYVANGKTFHLPSGQQTTGTANVYHKYDCVGYETSGSDLVLTLQTAPSEDTLCAASSSIVVYAYDGENNVETLLSFVYDDDEGSYFAVWDVGSSETSLGVCPITVAGAYLFCDFSDVSLEIVEIDPTSNLGSFYFVDSE